MDHMLRDRRKPKTINCHLGCIMPFTLIRERRKTPSFRSEI
jgi:hypothetical protein